MNAVQVFDFQENAVRILEQNGQPWFIASDVCRVLDLSNASEALRALDEEEKITISNPEGNPRHGIPHTLSLISESGLYALIFKSRKPLAKAFRRWVTSEVLPQIRNQGFYLQTELDFEKHPAAREFADLFNWLRSLELDPCAAAETALSLSLRNGLRSKMQNKARAEQVYDSSQVLQVMEDNQWRVSALCKKALDQLGMSRATFYRCWQELKSLRLIDSIETTDGSLWFSVQSLPKRRGRPAGRTGKKRTVYISNEVWGMFSKKACALQISVSDLIEHMGNSFSDRLLKVTRSERGETQLSFSRSEGAQ